MPDPSGDRVSPGSLQTATTASEETQLDDSGSQDLGRLTGHPSTPSSFPTTRIEVPLSSPPSADDESAIASDRGPTSQDKRRGEDPAETEAELGKVAGTPKSATKATRRFKVEPVETIKKTHHTKDGNDGDVDKPKPKRRFAPQPVETSEKSSRRARPDQSSKQPETRRRFTPEAVEVEPRRRRGQPSDTDETPPQPSRRKFAPQPVESSTRRRRKASSEDENEEAPVSRQSTGGSNSGRRFSPELLETARGSFRKESSRSSRCATTDQTDGAPETTASLSPDHAESPLLHESRFSAANLARKQSRQHSFVVPELPCIDSDSTGEDSALHSASESASGTPEESFHRKGHRERRDGPYRKQALSEAAEKAEKQLREQALAAFPNEQVHHRVHHFACEESDEDSIPGKLAVDNGMDPKVLRRESAADLGIEMQQMQKHHEQLENAKKELKEDTAGQSRFSAAALSARHRSFVKKVGGPSQRGVGLTEMRNAASPPMAGADLVFVLSEEPKTSIPGVGQFGVPKNKEDEIERVVEDQTMWSAGVAVNTSHAQGLWMGCCHQTSKDDKKPPTPIRSGLMTPAIVDEKPVGAKENLGSQGAGNSFLHPLLTPQNSQNSHTFADSVSKRLKEELTLEQEIESEFNGAFVTQIYNYLSLGYPSVARDFDEELSKISLVSVEELRRDDDQTDAKGYVDAPEGVGLDQEVAAEGGCARWTALRLYIHEWARQEPVMAERKPGWGVHERRGSWAV